MQRDPDLERRLLKDLRPAEADPGQLAPEPPAILFKSYRLDVLSGMDPVSGAKIVNLVATAGNYAFQIILPLPTLNVAALIRDLQATLGPVPDGVPSIDQLAGEDGGAEA